MQLVQMSLILKDIFPYFKVVSVSAKLVLQDYSRLQEKSAVWPDLANFVSFVKFKKNLPLFKGLISFWRNFEPTFNG